MTSSPDAGIVLVPHTHWDREWYEPHEVFRLRLVHVLDDVLDRLDQDHQFCFTLDGQAMAIQDYLEIRPGSRAQVERLVADGRLAIGPFLILLDEFGCDGETIVRNLEFGTTAAGQLGAVMQVGYLPDMFGHTAQMPQILRGFGIEHAALWRGVPDAVREHAFAWSAPDGSTVRTEYLFDGYGSALDLFAVPGRLAELAAQYRHRTRSWYGEDAVVGMLGTDHSAPAADLMERVREHNAQAPATGAPRIRVVTLGEHLLAVSTGRASTDRASTALVRGELRSHARGNLLPGVFSIRTNLKAEMAAAELALTRAERLDALYSDEDHRAFFDLAWQRVVQSSAHDSITGCGIDETADQVSARLASATQIGRAVAERVAGGLAAAVPTDARLVLNTLPWARTVQVEVVVTPDDAAEQPVGVQVLAELDTILGDEQVATADLVRLLRRIHGRELFGQQITAYRWGEGSLHFDVAEVPDGVFDLAALTAEIEAAMASPHAADRSWAVVTTARSRRRLLLEVEVPALGHVAVRPAACTLLSPSQVTATPTNLDNGLVGVGVGADGTLTVTGADGTVLHGVGRLVDEGDRGDSYNFGPVAGAPPHDAPAAVHVEVRATGPVRGVVVVDRHYDLPVGVDPGDRDLRLTATARLQTRMSVELRAGEPFVRLTVDLLNTVRDHRLRLHMPLGEGVQESFGAGQFDVTRRGRIAEGGWGEHPLPTFPATGFVSAGRAHVLLAKLTEYEVVGSPTGAADGDELALTLLRAVGMMSVNLHPLRDEPAGSELAVPGAQYVGTEVRTRLAVLPSTSGWEQAEVARWAEVFRHEALVCQGSAPSGGPLPPAVAGPALDGPAVMTSLRRIGTVGDGGAVEARLVSVASTDSPVGLRPPEGHHWIATDLAGRPTGAVLDPAPEPTMLPAWEIRTLRTVRTD